MLYIALCYVPVFVVSAGFTVKHLIVAGWSDKCAKLAAKMC